MTMQQLAAEQPVHPPANADSPQTRTARKASAARNGNELATARRVPVTRGRKRARGGGGGSSSEQSDADYDENTSPQTPVPVRAGGRSLRPRAPKPAEKVRQERELEAAYRRAVAE